MISQRGKATPGAVALVLCLALGGCGVARLLQPAPAEAPKDAVMPPSLRFTLADGTILPARSWLPPAGVPWRGVILALHGFTDSRDAWEVPAPRFTAAGYALYAPDQRGWGAAADRGRWAGGPRMASDAGEIVAQLRALYPGLPVIVMGESMGGAIAALLAARPDAPQDATVLLAPAVWGWDQQKPALAAALRGLNAVAPGWAPDPGRAAPPIMASDNIEALRRMGQDPLTLRNPPISATKGLVDLMSEAQDAMPHLHGRVLILSGRRDQLVPGAATAAAWAKLPPEVRRAFYPHGYHLLPRDSARDLVIDDILAWLADPDAWLPSGADAAAAAWEASAPWQGGPSSLLPATGTDTDFQPDVWPF